MGCKDRICWTEVGGRAVQGDFQAPLASEWTVDLRASKWHLACVGHVMEMNVWAFEEKRWKWKIMPECLGCVFTHICRQTFSGYFKN